MIRNRDDTDLDLQPPPGGFKDAAQVYAKSHARRHTT
jgi:hypothetical protein